MDKEIESRPGQIKVFERFFASSLHDEPRFDRPVSSQVPIAKVMIAAGKETSIGSIFQISAPEPRALVLGIAS